MYHFTDIRDAPKSVQGLNVTFNGHDWLAKMNNANGSFKVLTVSGRGLLAQKHQTTDVVGRNGSYFHRKTYEARELAVKVLLEGNNDLAYRKQYELLNTLLDSPEPAYLSFSDESDRFYLAQFKEADTGEEVVNRTVLTLSFICYDPFKYSAERVVTFSVSSRAINYVGDVPTKPILELTVKATLTELRILHVQKQVYVRLAFPNTARLVAGNVVRIDMQTGSVSVRGRNGLEYLDMVNSRFFSLDKGNNSLNFGTAVDGVIKFREVYR